MSILDTGGFMKDFKISLSRIHFYRKSFLWVLFKSSEFFFIILIMRWTFKIFLNYKCHVMSWTFLYPFFIFTCSYIQRKGEEEHLKKFHDTMHDFLKFEKKSYSLYNYINDRDLLYWDGIRRQERFYFLSDSKLNDIKP